MSKKTGYIAAIARGHNSGVCLLKDGKIVFSIEEERLSRVKYDGGPYASMVKILQYTDKIDYLVIAHTQSLKDRSTGRVDYNGDDVYTGLARKLGLIDKRGTLKSPEHPQVIDLSHIHHKLHAALAFYRSGWDDAAALIVDGAGTFIPATHSAGHQMTVFETETIFDCAYPNDFITKYKHYGTSENCQCAYIPAYPSDSMGEPGSTHEAVFSDRAGIVKVYEAVTQYCGFSAIEAGKTMGLFPYGKPNKEIPELFVHNGKGTLSNRNLIIPTYPNAALVNYDNYHALEEKLKVNQEDLTELQSRRDLAYACQTDTQEEVRKLIYKAVEMTGKKKVVISGGYGLNCVANYYYLDTLRKDGIEIYVEPVSNDAGTAMGAALLYYYSLSQSTDKDTTKTLYLGPKYELNNEDIMKYNDEEGIEVVDCNDEEVVKLMTEKNIVALWQGQSENGPRALGNRSLLFDPRFKDGKDFVNRVKRREYFRPFAGSILHEYTHEWFDLRGMEETPHMMYAVNCKPGVEEKIPSIIHVDGTCRIQSVKQEDNELYYRLIKKFHEVTECPIVFNTSFNLGGEPLVETVDDAVRTLKNSEIEYLYLIEYGKLVKVKNG